MAGGSPVSSSSQQVPSISISSAARRPCVGSIRARPDTLEGPLTVEHLLPQSWEEHWPLPDGSKGLTWLELTNAATDDPIAIATRERNRSLQTFGNLTVLTQPLNSSVSNSPWSTKRPAIMNASLLPINQQLHQANTWDENAIGKR